MEKKKSTIASCVKNCVIELFSTYEFTKLSIISSLLFLATIVMDYYNTPSYVITLGNL